MDEQLTTEYNRRHALASVSLRQILCTPPVICLSVLLGLLMLPVLGWGLNLAASPWLPTTTTTTTTTTTATRTTTTTTTSSSTTTTSTTATTSSTTKTGSTTTLTTSTTVSSTTISTTRTTSATTTTPTTTSATTATNTATATTTTVFPPAVATTKKIVVTQRGGNLRAPAAPAPPAVPATLEETPVLVSMTVQNLDYQSLMANPGLQAAFEAQVCGAIALEAGHGIAPDHVLLRLEQGSVAIKATIVSLSADTASIVQSQLEESTRLGPRVAQSVGAVQGISEISTGDLTVTDISTSGPMVSKGPGIQQIVSIFLVVIGGMALLAVLCFSFICHGSRRSPPRNDSYTMVETNSKEELLPLAAEHSGSTTDKGTEPSSPKPLLEQPAPATPPVQARQERPSGARELAAAAAPRRASAPDAASPQPASVAAEGQAATPQRPPEGPAAPGGAAQPSAALPGAPAAAAQRRASAPGPGAAPATPQQPSLPSERPAAAPPQSAPAVERPLPATPMRPAASPERPGASPKDLLASPPLSARSARSGKSGRSGRSARSPPGSARSHGEADAAVASYQRLAKDMGFSEDQANAALSEVGGNTEQALEKLLSRP